MTVTFVLLGAALLAMAMMFIHPSVAIFIFWLGMLVAAASAVIEWYVRRLERNEVRKSLATHHCPQCNHEVDPDAGQSPLWHCDQCGTQFSMDGEIVANA